MTEIKKNWLEWAVFYASLVLVFGVVGFLCYDWATAAGRPPELEVTLGPPERRGAAHAVPVKVTNGGEQTAEGVRVEVVLTKGEGGEERGDFTLAFVPRGSEREGWVQFETDPGAGRLRARVLGYEKP